MQRQLLTIAAGLECLAGLALFLAPGITTALLLGAQGVALFSLAAVCWGARAGSGGAAETGTLWAIALANVGLLLIVFAATGMARGPMM